MSEPQTARELAIPVEMGNFGHEVTKLMDSVLELEKRLGPVMQPRGPEKEPGSTPDSRAVVTPLATDIYKGTSQVRNARIIIESMLVRLEV
jgi:hypothetical protein